SAWNDQFVCAFLIVKNTVAVRTGAGNDGVTVTRSRLDGATRFDGGSGTNSLTLTGNSFRNPPGFIGFQGGTTGTTGSTGPTGPTGGAPQANDDQATVGLGAAVHIVVSANDVATQ